jgi:hypothetical protein
VERVLLEVPIGRCVLSAPSELAARPRSGHLAGIGGSSIAADRNELHAVRPVGDGYELVLLVAETIVLAFV